MKYSILFSCLMLLSCSGGGEKANLNGRLVYGGQGIYSLELSQGKYSRIKPLPTLSVDEVNRIDDQTLLISTYNLEPSEERDKIEIYDLQAEISKSVLDGSRGVYIAEYEKAF